MTSLAAAAAPSVCHACATDLPAGARFCPACGAEQPGPACGACGAELLAGARFCTDCGTPRAGTAVPRPAAPALAEPPAVDVLDDEPAPIAARRVTSVLFGDLVGFTSLAEGRDQEDVRELLTRYFDDARRIVARYGGTIEKFIGDAVMAVWGVPTAHEDDAERAVRAGLEMVDAVAGLRDEVGLAGLDIRIGVVTGEVAVTLGATGQGMVAGDAVNTASRVQSVAAPGQVWVDETTRLLTHAAITYAEAGSHQLKGKAEPTALWSVGAVVANVGGAQRADGLEAPLIGRDRELRLVKELYHRTEESRQPSLLVVSSDPGLGKTRLGWEFSKYSDGLSGEVRWLEGRCVAYGDSVAYFALAEAIRGRLWALGAEREAGAAGSAADAVSDTEGAGDRPDDAPGRWDGDRPADLAELLDLGLTTYVPDSDERDWIRPRLAALLLGSQDTFAQDDLFAAWIRFLQLLAAGAEAVVLLVDDAEHADEGFIAFLEQALRTDGLALYVLLLARHELLERFARMATNRRVSVLTLSPLSDPEMSALVSGLVGGLPAPVRDGLVRRAGGVPLYAIETVRSMIDRDLVVPRGGQYVLADPHVDLDSIGSPASLHALVASRLDALSPSARSVVDHASVLGQAFTRDDLEALRGERSGDLDAVLAELVHRQVLSRESHRLSAGQGRYSFVQDVVRQVAYGMLARRDRRAAHLRVADHLGDGEGELAPVVARHLIGAAEAVPQAPDVDDLRRRARLLLVAASRRTLSLGLATGAVEQLTTAAGLCDDEVDRARIETLLARAYGTERSFAEQEAVAARALEVLDAHGEVEAAAMAAGHLGFAYGQTGRAEAAIALMRPRWEAVLARDGADEAVCLVGRYLLRSMQDTGRNPEIMPVAMATMAAAERTGDDLAVLRLLEILSNAARAMRLPRLAAGYAEMIVALTREAHLDSSDFSGLALQAVQAIFDDLPDARRRMGLVDEVIERQRLLSMRGWMTLERLQLDLCAGSWAAVDAAYDDFADLLEAPERGPYAFVGLRMALARGHGARPDWVAWTQAGPRDPDATPGGLLGRGVRVAAADPLAAAELGLEAAERARLMGGSEDFLLLVADCVDLVVAGGSAQQLREVLRLLPTGDADRSVEVSLRAHRARARGLLARMEGAEPEVVEGHLREAVEAYDAWGARLWARRTAADLATLLIAHGRAEQASALLRPVRELYQQIGAVAWLAELPDPRGRGPTRLPAPARPHPHAVMTSTSPAPLPSSSTWSPS